MNERLQDLLDHVQRTACEVGDAAAETVCGVGKKAGTLLSVAKLNVKIMELEGEVRDALQDVGSMIYSTHTGHPTDSELLLQKLQEIEIDISQQLETFGASILLGLSLGLIYDLLRAFRLRSPRWTALLDGLYCLILGCSIFLFTLHQASGELRLYVLLGIFGGNVLFFCALSPWLRPLWDFWVETFAEFLRLLSIPVRICRDFCKKTWQTGKSLFYFAEKCYPRIPRRPRSARCGRSPPGPAGRLDCEIPAQTPLRLPGRPPDRSAGESRTSFENHCVPARLHAWGIPVPWHCLQSCRCFHYTAFFPEEKKELGTRGENPGEWDTVSGKQGRAEALLAGGEPVMRRLLAALEVGLERVHPGGGEQHRRIVLGRNERRRRQAAVVAALEEAEEALADLVGGHRCLSLGCTACASCRRASSTRTAGSGCTRIGSSAPTARPASTAGSR